MTTPTGHPTYWRLLVLGVGPQRRRALARRLGAGFLVLDPAEGGAPDAAAADLVVARISAASAEPPPRGLAGRLLVGPPRRVRAAVELGADDRIVAGAWDDMVVAAAIGDRRERAVVAAGLAQAAAEREALRADVGRLELALADVVAGRAVDERTDRLTELLSAATFRQLVAEEEERAARYSGEFSVVGIDVRDFTQFNALFGREEGDALLRQAALTLTVGRRRSDRVFRLDGDTFAVLLPHTGPAGAERVVTRLTASLAGISLYGLPVAVDAVIATIPVECPARDAEALLTARLAERRAERARGTGRMTADAH